MKFLKTLLNSRFSKNPDDYQNIFFRWEVGGNEYGPSRFDIMLTNDWSSPPLEGRFENEDKWKKYDSFLDVLNNLSASQHQLDLLNKYNISIDTSTLTFRDANRVIDDKIEELGREKAARIKAKQKLPATKNTRQKLEAYGIDFSNEITRIEAKNLISMHEECEEAKEIVNRFRETGISLTLKSDIETLSKESGGYPSFADLLSDLFDLVTKLIEFDVLYTLPQNLNSEIISKINIKLEDVFFDLEDAEEQIRDREFSTFDGDFKVVGKLPKKNFKLMNKEILENHMQGNWDFERDIVDLLKKHFPDLRLKKDKF